MTGLIYDLAEAEYHARPEISISRLRELKLSPMNYQYRLHHPRETDPMSLGRTAHRAILEPHRLAEYVVWNRLSENGNPCPRRGQHWDKFQADNAGKTIILPDELDTASTMRDAVRGDPIAFKYLAHGAPEVTMVHEGRRGRVDWLTEVDGMPHLVGLKTARNCRPYKFANAAATYSYPMYWAFYYDLYKAITGKHAEVREIVVESAPPHPVVVYVIDEGIIERGREQYLELLELLRHCEEHDDWPGPATSELILTMPDWFYQTGSENDLASMDLEA